MASNSTAQMDHKELRLVETQGVDINSTRSLTRLYQRDDFWTDESSSSPEKTSSMCEEQLPHPHKSVNSKMPIIKANLTNQITSFGSKERNIGVFLGQDNRYSALNNHVHKKPSSASHVDMLSQSTDIINTRALEGLIVMCNDRVRRSFFKHGVLGVPLRKKPILDRVDANTLIFLFEFEARALWGIYQASSEVSIDIEKDAYRGSETAFPVQVKFHILQKCRPLPEKLFKLAIANNYYTPTKFHFELTNEQVTFLTRLYYMRDAEKLGLNNSALSTEEIATLFRTAVKDRFLGAVYQGDGVRTNGRDTLCTQRNQTTIIPSQCKELLVRGSHNPEENSSTPYKDLTNDADYPRYFLWHPKDLPNLKTHKDHSHMLRNQGSKCTTNDESSHGCASAKVDSSLHGPRTTSLYCYPNMEEGILSENDLRLQLCQAKLFHYAGNPIQTPPENLSSEAMGSNARTEQSFDEEYYLRMLKLEQLNSSIHSRMLLLRNHQPEISACQRLQRSNSACDVPSRNLHLHPKKSLNPCSTKHTPANHHMELILTPEMQTWQMHDTPQESENGHAMETQTKARLISSGNMHAQTHDYSVEEGFTQRGDTCTQSHVYSVDGDSLRGKASACIRGRAPPEEVWQEDLCHKGLMALRSKSVHDSRGEDSMCTAKCCTSKRETVHSDDEHWLESLLCKVKDSLPKRQEAGDVGVWLGDNGHVSVNTSDIMSKSCNGVPNLLKDEEQDIQLQPDRNGLSELNLRRGKSPVGASVTQNEVAAVKPPRKSVWSRLSTSRNWLNCRQISIHNEDIQSELNNLPYSEALFLKRKVDVTEYIEVDEMTSINEDYSGIVEDGINVHFKRRKLGTSTKADRSTASQEQGGPGGVDDNRMAITRTHCSDPRERRKIRRPL